MNKFLYFFIFCSFACTSSAPEIPEEPIIEPIVYNLQIPVVNNTFISRGDEFIESEILTSEGIKNWSNSYQSPQVYFHLTGNTEIQLGIYAKVTDEPATILVLLNEQEVEIEITNRSFERIDIGTFKITEQGYQNVSFRLKDMRNGAQLSFKSLLLGEQVKTQNLQLMSEDIYWTHRGPSVHLNYKKPDEAEEIKWFYSELMIPKGEDALGSFFMANGFGQGYFGMQVNSKTERRVLFSVWSAYSTDDPNEIPDDYKVELVQKGKDVYSGDFGHEGSGRQNILTFDWKTETTYKFLLGAKPSEDGTNFIAYFHEPQNGWQLIAEVDRPKLSTNLTNMHGFLENFIPIQGAKSRMGVYKNQWVKDENSWHEITKMTFTADNTARNGYRLDYSGGTFESNAFYLKNCGFTNDHTTIGSTFQRINSTTSPDISSDILDWNKR